MALSKTFLAETQPRVVVPIEEEEEEEEEVLLDA
jgi:hypothetical protein